MAPKDATSPLRAPRPAPSGPVDAERAEAALVEHYPRLVRLAYLVLPPSAARHRRVLAAHAAAQRSLPRGRGARGAPAPEHVPGSAPDPAYALLRLGVLRAALAADRPPRRFPGAGRPVLPPLWPLVLGLRLSPRAGGPDALALERELSRVSGAARAAYALRVLEGLPDGDAVRLLAAAGAADPRAALAEADGVRPPAGSRDRSLPVSAEFDPCSLRARPADPARRRQNARAAAVAGCALAVCGLLLGLPGDGWGPDGAAAPVYARNPAAERALDPELLLRAEAGAWRRSARTDFSVWPARGGLTGDTGLLRRALAVWARPGPDVRVTATPGTPSGPAAGPARLLYAGEVDGSSVVVLHDGLRVVRYAEPAGGRKGPVALDFARTDGADAASAGALVVSRGTGSARYLTAPWITGASVVDLLDPADRGRPVERSADGLTAPVAGPPLDGSPCRAWPALRLTPDGAAAGRSGTQGAGPYLLTDLGELSPVRLTFGAPGGAVDAGAAGEAARTVLARTACRLPALAGRGVRTVNSWRFAEQRLPEGAGRAGWVCTRADTWRGAGSPALVRFLAPAGEPDAPDVVAARSEDGPACGVREERVLGGVLWRAPSGVRYLLAAGSDEVVSISVTGGVTHRAAGRTLAVEADEGVRVELSASLVDGGRLAALH
ncbi:hypothetical protein GCM10010420_31000 [Streptomyces glaucosporus]|uniref:DNA-directed RNA polymerase specialized sigma24 family protein n=1 Tax=Streptomyces glaucosporus TaxID=284044 RepID=A0ABN3IEX2_9ACTN